MKLNCLLSLLAVLLFSHNAYSCEQIGTGGGGNKTQVKTQVNANDIVTIAIGENVRTHTRIGAIRLDNNQQQESDIEIGTIIHETIGNNISSCLQLPIGNINCN